MGSEKSLSFQVILETEITIKSMRFRDPWVLKHLQLKPKPLELKWKPRTSKIKKDYYQTLFSFSSNIKQKPIIFF